MTAQLSNMQQLTKNMLETLKSLLIPLQTSKDRHIKGHAMALLNKLQELNPQDDILMCEGCQIKEKLPLWKVCGDCLLKINHQDNDNN